MQRKKYITENVIEKSNYFNMKWKVITAITAIFTILLCTLPMNLSPMWNGEIPEHRNQYELLADSMLNGHLYIDYDDIDENLLKMENPYDTDARKEQNVRVHWDNAFYNGHYYMYFGVAPVILTFIPYKIITGHSLTTYHATQIYVALFIIGVFLLFYKLCKIFYSETNKIIYVACSVVFSVVSIWYSITTPALYCTAITAGLCMAIWSIYFFIKSVYEEKNENKSIFYAFFGSLFGAITFACRPPIGLVNFLVIPMLVHFIKNHKMSSKMIGKLFIAALPYFVIAILLMLYNYARFNSPLEFGQTYQLTSVDQHNYSSTFSNIDFSNLITNILINFFGCGKYTSTFPFVTFSGAFLNFPILLLPLMTILDEKFRNKLKENKILALYVILMLVPLMVTIMDSLWSPWLMERYRMDIYYLMAIATFISIINYYSITSKKKIFMSITIILLILTFIKTILLFMVPNDYNLTAYYPEVLEKLIEITTFK